VAVYFCDSSAIVKCYVQEQGSVWMVTLLDATARHHLYLARITGVEVIAAIRRYARRDDIAAPDAPAALAQCRQDCAGLYRIIEITPALITRATVLAETHTLRGCDAVQLAAAVEVRTVTWSLTSRPNAWYTRCW
jgi:predicted nucleic acid-binding protein